MRKIRRSTSIVFILISFILASPSCDNKEKRLEVFGYSIGQAIPSDRFEVSVDNKDLDFPYREVYLKSNDNIIFQIIGDSNIIYQITQTDIAFDKHDQMVNSISKRLRFEPERKENVVLSNIWLCDMLIWRDKNTYDIITLTKCKHKNDSLDYQHNWELTIKNDSVREKLQKEYNTFY